MKRLEYNEGDNIGDCIFVRADGFFQDSHRKNSAAIFKCQCGKEFRQTITLVKARKITSCGCRIVKSAKARKYGTLALVADISEYSIWVQMKSRCLNPDYKRYNDYGGRGITVFEPWINCFEDFYAYVGPRPSMKHSLDRYPNVNGNYEPGNVRWATDREQAINRRDNHILEYNGVSVCISEWANRLGLNQRVIWHRLDRGYSIEDALYPGRYSTHGNKMPVGQHKKSPQL